MPPNANPEEYYEAEPQRCLSALADLDIVKPICPAIKNKGPCCATPTIPCEKCRLVAYCSHACRTADEKGHLGACDLSRMFLRSKHNLVNPNVKYAWAQDIPDFWAPYAATNILNIANNEGIHYDGTLRLLLSGNFGIRHFIYSIANLPPESKARFDVHIYQTEGRELARTILAIQLLLPIEEEEEESEEFLVRKAQAAIHTLYSSWIPESVRDYVKHRVTEGFPRLYQRLQEKGLEGNVPEFHVQELFGKTWKIKTMFKPGILEDFIAAFNVSFPWTRQEYAKERLLGGGNYVQEDCAISLGRMPRGMFNPMVKWTTDGALLPYSHPSGESDVLNPLFAWKKDSFPAGSTKPPLSEWPGPEVLDFQIDNTGLDNVYGKMFFYLQDLFVRYQKRIRSLNLEFQICSWSLADYSTRTCSSPRSPVFDRIVAGNELDVEPHRLLISLTALLRHDCINSRATALTMRRGYSTKTRKKMTTKKGVLEPYVPHDSKETMKLCQYARRVYGKMALMDRMKLAEIDFGNKHFRAWMPEGLTKSVLNWDFLGMRRRKQHIIVPRFPWQLLDSSTNTLPSQVEFDKWISWPNAEIEVWVEWHKVDDPPAELFTEWLDRYEIASLMGQFKTRPSKDSTHDVVPWREYTRPGLCYNFIDARHRDEWLSGHGSRTSTPGLVQYDDIKENFPAGEETGNDAENTETDASAESEDLEISPPAKTEEPKATAAETLAAMDFSFLDDHKEKVGVEERATKKRKKNNKGRKK